MGLVNDLYALNPPYLCDFDFKKELVIFLYSITKSTSMSSKKGFAVFMSDLDIFHSFQISVPMITNLFKGADDPE